MQMYSEKEFTRVQPYHSTRGCKTEEVGDPHLSASIFARSWGLSQGD